MALFGKKKLEKAGCDCGKCYEIGTESVAQAQTFQSEPTAVKVLGSGCKKCKALEENTKIALAQLGLDTTIDHVTDFSEIATYGVMSTPALMVNGKVISSGKVLKADEVVKLLKKSRE